MRTVILPEALSPRVGGSSPSLRIGSGPASPLFESGPQTRIFRAPVSAIGAATCGDRDVWGQVLDISLGGCLLQTDDAMEIGESINLRITIIGDGRRAVAEVRGVVRREATVNGRDAYGIEFVASNSDDRQTLQWLYAQALR